MPRDSISGVESNSSTATGSFERVTVSKKGIKTALDTMMLNSLVPEKYDYISLSYTGIDLTTVVYKLNGAAGTTVATLTLAYTANVLQTVTRT
jgi:hypothetical protein